MADSIGDLINATMRELGRLQFDSLKASFQNYEDYEPRWAVTLWNMFGFRVPELKRKVKPDVVVNKPEGKPMNSA